MVQSGPATILASGEATTFAGHPLVLTLNLRPTPFVVELSFASDEGEPRVDTEPRDDGFHLRCLNFDEPGRGSAMPVLLGAQEDDLYFLHFRVFRWGRTADRTVHYTFFRTTKEAVGFEER